MTKDYQLIHLDGLFAIFMAKDWSLLKLKLESEKDLEGLIEYKWYTINISDETTPTT